MKPPNNYSRRKFIQTTGVSSISMLLGSSYLLSACGTKEGGEAIVEEVVQAEIDPIHNISIQLYTVRNQLNEDVAGTLQKVADAGFKYVETYDFSETLSFEEIGKILKDTGLSVSSMHSEIPLGEEGEKALQRAEAYSCKKVIFHGWPEDQRYRTQEGIQELAGIYNDASQFLKSNGLQLGLHNHWWEIKKDEAGHYPLETLMNLIDDNIFLELDTYWVKTAGQDPAEVIRKYGKRVQFMHIKDGPAEWPDDLGTVPHRGMVAVGKGTQDFNAIAEACGDDPKWMVVELDECETDIFQAIKDSYDYLTSNSLAKA